MATSVIFFLLDLILISFLVVVATLYVKRDNLQFYLLNSVEFKNLFKNPNLLLQGRMLDSCYYRKMCFNFKYKKKS